MNNLKRLNQSAYESHEFNSISVKKIARGWKEVKRYKIDFSDDHASLVTKLIPKLNDLQNSN